MSLRRLLGLSAAVSRRLCRSRSLATAAMPPPWAIIQRRTAAAEGPAPGPGASVYLGHPPHLSSLSVPKHLVRTSASPDPDSDVIQSIHASVCSASSDGLLLLSFVDLRVKAPILAQRGAARLREERPTGLDPDHAAHCTHFVCNPVTGELSRLPDPRSSYPVSKVMCGLHVGLLTRADGGHDGPPDRFALAELHGDQMVRFLSETGEWETVPVSPCQLPHTRRMVLDREVVAFGGRLWWLDATCGAISADPFSDRPELCFVELPRGSVLPAAAQDGCDCGGACGCGTSSTQTHRRLYVSEGRLRYVEVSREEPFLLSTFVLDDEGCGWTLERRLDLSRIDPCGYPVMPCPWKRGIHDTLHCLTPSTTIGSTYRVAVLLLRTTTLKNTPQVIFAVDMNANKVISGNYMVGPGDPSFVPCVLAPWLESSRIPSAGKKDVEKNTTLADVLVRSDGHHKR